MADQTFKARFLQQGESIDYTPVGAIAAGAVVLLGTLVCIAKLAIAAGKLGAVETLGAFKVAKDASAPAAGDPIYWQPTGSPVGGTASSGAFSTTAAGGYLAGYAILAALTGDATVNINLDSGPRVGGGSTTVNASVAATGTIQGDAAPVAEGFTVVTGADGTVGVKLPTAVANKVVTLKNNANAALKVWPFLGDGINAVAVNGSYSMAAFTSVTFTAIDATTWISTPLVAS